ncbi:MAG: hypothetical protein RQ985_00040 [Dehalococcoidia bacterium]|nr:hypothetical protein [Dehalococcoidia bacterium]
MTTVSIALKRSTGNFWVDTGLVVLAHGLGEGDHTIDRVRSWVLDQLTQKTGKKGLYYDLASGQLREYEKTNWVYPTNLFIKVAGAPGQKVTIGGETYPTQPPIFDLKLDLTKKPGTCDICGEDAPLTDAKMWMLPLLVDPDKFGNFYPGLKRGTRLCARCALAGAAAYVGWLWKAQGQDALHIFVFHSELGLLAQLHRSVLRPWIQARQDKGGNAPTAFSGPYVHETALGLLLALFSHARSSDVLDPEGRQLLAGLLGTTPAPPPPITLYAITGKPGQAFQMTALREFTRLHHLFRLYERWLDVVSPLDNNRHARVVHIFEQFRAQRQGKWETMWRDRIAWAVLTFDDPFPGVAEFLYEVRAREENRRPLVEGTLQILEAYAREVMGMDEQFQRTLAGFGHHLGEKAHEQREMGLLYDLRNAKNPEAFYRVLNDAQFRLETNVPEALLNIEKGERIAGMSWLRVKTILSIYAMNAYLRKERREPTQEG